METVTITTQKQGLVAITREINQVVAAMAKSQGLCTLFIQHTSASLIIRENYDPSAQHDLESWLNRLVPENDPLYTHTLEGPDDMPAHIKSVLTATSLSIPVVAGSFALGTWQGVYLWEHRKDGGRRKILVHIAD